MNKNVISNNGNYVISNNGNYVISLIEEFSTLIKIYYVKITNYISQKIRIREYIND